MNYTFNDGGREAAGYKGHTGDCVARAISIARSLTYQEVYAALANGNANERKTTTSSGKRSARDGIHVTRDWFKRYMAELGFTWTPTMQIGSGCKVHLRDGELPLGYLVVQVSKHYTAVINGIINDTHDPSRDGTRCVYGYWKLGYGMYPQAQD